MSPLISIHFLQRQSDDKLVALASAGNERAFETLVRRYRRPLLAYARRLSGSEARAEDALQQALLQAWIALCADAKPDHIRPWLFRIVHNVVVSGLRRQQHHCVELDEALDTAELIAGADARIECREALSGLAALPELQRRAIVLTAFGGNSHGEVAAALGLTDGAVRGLVYRARATLRSAAAVLPLPIARWAANRSSRRTSVLERVGELLSGGGAAGAGGILLKGGATVATVGALATATQMFVPAQHHFRPRIAPVAGAATREQRSRPRGSFRAASLDPASPVASAAAGPILPAGQMADLRLAPGSRAVGSRGDRGRIVTLAVRGAGDAANGARSGAASGGGDSRSGSSGGDSGARSGDGGGSGPGGGQGDGSGASPGGDGSSGGPTSSAGGAVATIAGDGGGTSAASNDGGGSGSSSTSATTSGSGDGGSSSATTGGGGSDGASGGGTDSGSSDGGGGGSGGGGSSSGGGGSSGDGTSSTTSTTTTSGGGSGAVTTNGD